MVIFISMAAKDYCLLSEPRTIVLSPYQSTWHRKQKEPLKQYCLELYVHVLMGKIVKIGAYRKQMVAAQTSSGVHGH